MNERIPMIQIPLSVRIHDLLIPLRPPKQEIPRCILIKRNLHAMKSTIVWMNDRESFAKNNSKVSLNGTTIRHRFLDHSLNIHSNIFRDKIQI